LRERPVPQAPPQAPPQKPPQAPPPVTIPKPKRNPRNTPLPVEVPSPDWIQPRDPPTVPAGPIVPAGPLQRVARTRQPRPQTFDVNLPPVIYMGDGAGPLALPAPPPAEAVPLPPRRTPPMLAAGPVHDQHMTPSAPGRYAISTGKGKTQAIEIVLAPEEEGEGSSGGPPQARVKRPTKIGKSRLRLYFPTTRASTAPQAPVAMDTAESVGSVAGPSQTSSRPSESVASVAGSSRTSRRPSESRTRRPPADPSLASAPGHSQTTRRPSVVNSADRKQQHRESPANSARNSARQSAHRANVDYRGAVQSGSRADRVRSAASAISLRIGSLRSGTSWHMNSLD